MDPTELLNGYTQYIHNLINHKMEVITRYYTVTCSGGFRGGKGGANAPLLAEH